MKSLTFSLALSLLCSTASVLAQSDMVPMPACLVSLLNPASPFMNLGVRADDMPSDNLSPQPSPRLRLQLLHARVGHGRQCLYTDHVRAQGPDLYVAPFRSLVSPSLFLLRHLRCRFLAGFVADEISTLKTSKPISIPTARPTSSPTQQSP